jgi:hypothetical protein
LLQGSYFTFQQAQGLHRYDAPVGASQYLVFKQDYFKTLAPRAYITYYQARGLSGHTSPCGEYAYFLTPTLCLPCLHFFLEIQVDTLHREENLFLFSQEHHTFFGQPISPATTVVGCISNWSVA